MAKLLYPNDWLHKIVYKDHQAHFLIILSKLFVILPIALEEKLKTSEFWALVRPYIILKLFL